MNVNRKLMLALFGGVAIGGVAVHGLHAQTKPIAYVIAEIDVTNQEAFTKEYVPLATKALSDGGSGYKRVAVGKIVSIEGAAPKPRVVINSFDNMDKALAAFNSPAYKEARKIGDKYASSFRVIAVEAAQ